MILTLITFSENIQWQLLQKLRLVSFYIYIFLILTIILLLHYKCIWGAIQYKGMLRVISANWQQMLRHRLRLQRHPVQQHQEQTHMQFSYVAKRDTHNGVASNFGPSCKKNPIKTIYSI